MFANYATETSIESCIIQFPTAQPYSTKVDVLETGNAPILFLKRENWVLNLNWTQKETKFHVQLLACSVLKSSIPHWGILCGT